MDSLDSSNDLKSGDIRKRLIDYSLNPVAFKNAVEEIESKSESPFEAAVAKSLVAKGYHLVQQWPVGSYRLDMVAVCGKKTVAIECDGERWHSGDSKIREDMERQTILERLGWRFIRIRGSEYFRQPQKTIERVVKALAEFGIEPEDQAEDQAEDAVVSRDTELLKRVKARAFDIISKEPAVENGVDLETISAALDPVKETKRIISGDAESVATINLHQVEHIGETPRVRLDERQAQATPNESGQVSPKKSGVTTDSCLDYSVEQTVLTGMEENVPEEKDVITLIKKANVPYIDKRNNCGNLWIIGGKDELAPLVAKCQTLGYKFSFKAGGGKATKGKDAWWAN